MKKIYNVVWIDDEYDKMSAFQEECEEIHGIKLYPFRTQKSGMDALDKNLDKWDGVLLDAKMLGIQEDDINIIARINDQEAIKNMVTSGLGISIISELAVKNLLAEKRVLGFPLDKKYSGRQIYLIYRKNYTLTDQLKDFLKFIQKKYTN